MAHSCDLSSCGSFGSNDARRRARRLLEGGLITEERFLQLQSEVYRLRREATVKDTEHKQLLARLSRAEDAAKRNMRDCFQQSLEPCKLKNNIIKAVNHTFHVDQKMQELDDKLREKQRQIDKVTEYNKQYKADIHSLRTRLDILLRTTRRTSPFVTPRDIHSAGSTHHGDKGGKELRKDVQRLQTENLDLQFQVITLSQPQPSEEVATQSFQSMQDIACQLIEDDLPVQSARGVTTKLLSGQIHETWQQLEGLQKRYERSMVELQSLKVNHEQLLGKLRDANRELNEERNKSMRLELSEMRVQQELLAAQQTGILLQQARQYNLKLENENAELIASASVLKARVQPEPVKVENVMIQTTKLEPVKVEDIMVQTSKLEHVKLEDLMVQTSLEQTSPKWTSPEWTSPEWTSPKRTSPEWTSPQRTSPESLELQDPSASPESLELQDPCASCC